LFNGLIEPFVLIGATTEEARIPRPLLSRFALRERLDLYAEEDLAKMALAAGRSRGVEVTEAGARALARGSRGTPRLLLAHLRRARGLARLAGTAVTGEIALRALERQGIDAAGLGATDRRILAVLLARKRPIGLRSLADLLGESAENIADVYEPFLLREGYILRTFRGRAATDKAREALEWKPALRRRPPPVPPAAPPGSGMPA
jgi:Holliday junction DNA helicase RuvB